MRALRIAFYVLPICPATLLTGSAGMNQHFGAKQVRSCLPWTPWIGVDQGTDVTVFAISAEYRPANPKITDTARGKVLHRRNVAAYTSCARPYRCVARIAV